MEDEVIKKFPIRFSNALAPKIHIHQFPLLTRPLHVPPSAAASGKRITARIKPVVRRLEVHIPADTRTEVWNVDRGRELGAARAEDDREKNQEPSSKGKGRETDEPRLSEVRMRSEQIQQPGVYMLGILRDGQLHLHPITETHQMRPTLTYLDVLSRKNKRSRAGSDSDSDEGPPPDPDEPMPAPVPVKKEKKTTGEAREVLVTARKSEDKSGAQALGGLSTARREMLAAIHAEEDEDWHDLQFFDVTTAESEEAFVGLFSKSEEVLQCKEDMTAFLKTIDGL
ncbi:DNA-directed RNA polymerase III subunit Rpc5 [Mycena amicta]|nr:DNA-directed RNA polymerase III subunit Rpc5 [Mycena amicta]